MTQDAKVGFGDTPVRSSPSTPPLDRRRPEPNDLQTPEYPSSLPSNVQSNVQIVQPKLYGASNPRLQGLADALDGAALGAAGAVRQLLTDQVTPLRLAGHVAVLSIAAVVLLLSQVSLPDWQLRFEPTPGAQLMSGLASAALAGTQTKSLASDFENDSLRPNLVLNFAEQSSQAALPQGVLPEAAVPEVRYYTVKSGDTVLGIAEKFGLAPETLMWSNSLIEQNPDLLKIGDQLRILPLDGVLHVVKRGDTLSSIADKYSTEMQAIVQYAANGMASAEATLPIGKEIVVPGGTKPYVAPVAGGSSTAYSVSRPPGALAGSGNFSWPTAGYVSQGYWRGHPGIDVAGWLGAPVTAADAGYVILAGGGWNSGYGNYAIVDHGNGFTTLYAHLSTIFVQPGATVSRGQQLGTMGNTGNSTGPHLHFEIRYNGVPYNPTSYLR
ncbi:MAG: peptidoglycan DD-metalloendopeptidase family protein [Caldilinea sp.]